MSNNATLVRTSIASSHNNATVVRNKIVIEINIEKDKAEAVFHCGEEYKVGGGTGRKVIFMATQPCCLKFPNDRIFGMPCTALSPNTDKTLPIDNAIGRKGTELTDVQVEIECTSEQCETFVKLRDRDPGRGDPRIVVP
jgi:hypothetical protein